MALRLRLAVLFALVTATLLASAGVVMLRGLQETLDRAVHSQLWAREGVLRRLVQHDAHRLDQADSPLLTSPFGERFGQPAQVVTPAGRVLLTQEVDEDEHILDAGQLRRVTAGRETLEFRAGADSPVEGALVRASPVVREGEGTWVVVVGADLAADDAVIQRTRTALLTGGLGAVLLSALGAWLLTGAALRPVEQLRREAEEISAQDAEASLPIPATGDELAALAETMNDLLGRLQGALSRQRQFVADAGHELRTPLTVLRAELELAARPGRTHADLTSAVAAACGETDRLIRLAEDLLLLARTDEGEPLLRRQATDVEQLLTAAARAAAERAPDEVAVTVEAPECLRVSVDPGRLRQAIDNLLDNALRYAPAGTAVELTARVDERRDSTWLTVEVSDRGPGFPPDFFDRAFERFQRADLAREPGKGGTGLGLAITRSLVRAHGGEATVAGRAGGGAQVRLELPVPVVTEQEDAPDAGAQGDEGTGTQVGTRRHGRRD